VVESALRARLLTGGIAVDARIEIDWPRRGDMKPKVNIPTLRDDSGTGKITASEALRLVF
jgi:hypothetical protein